MPPTAAKPAAATPAPTPAFAPVENVDAVGVSTTGTTVPVTSEVVLEVELEILLDAVDRLVVCEPLGAMAVVVPLHSPKSP